MRSAQRALLRVHDVDVDGLVTEQSQTIVSITVCERRVQRTHGIYVSLLECMRAPFADCRIIPSSRKYT